jgi:hypothetical protein
MRSFITEGERNYLRKEIERIIDNRESSILPQYINDPKYSKEKDELVEVCLSIVQNKIGFYTSPTPFVRAILNRDMAMAFAIGPLSLIHCIPFLFDFRNDYNPELNEVD